MVLHVETLAERLALSLKCSTKHCHLGNQENTHLGLAEGNLLKIKKAETRTHAKHTDERQNWLDAYCGTHLERERQQECKRNTGGLSSAWKKTRRTINKAASKQDQIVDTSQNCRLPSIWTLLWMGTSSWTGESEDALFLA